LSSTTDQILFEQIPVGNYKNFSYLVADQESKEAVIFDPAWDVPKLLGRLDADSLRLTYIVNTHSHHDHIEGNSSLQKSTGAKIVASSKSQIKKDIGVQDGDEIDVGAFVKLKFLLTPGHSPDSMCIVVNDFALITGDTLFIGECGRVDLPGGDALELFDSFGKIRKLNSKLVVYPGHDYGRSRSSTLGEQLHENYTLLRRSRVEFVKFMNEP
jgi:hydroxyacylglutathione hydrolase